MSAVDTHRLAELGEIELVDYTPRPGDPIRAFVRYGQLFGGSIIAGVIDQVIPGGRPWPKLGTPLHDPRCALYMVREYTWDFMPTAAPSTTTICLQEGDIVFLQPKGGQP